MSSTGAQFTYQTLPPSGVQAGRLHAVHAAALNAASPVMSHHWNVQQCGLALTSSWPCSLQQVHLPARAAPTGGPAACEARR